MKTPLPPRALSAHARPPRLVVTASAVATALGYLLWLRLSGAGAERRSLVAAALFIALDVALVAVFWRASASAALAPRMARALRLLGGAAAVAIVGRVIALVPLHAGAAGPRPSLADAFLVASYPLTLAAFLSFPMAARTADRWKLLFDAAGLDIATFASVDPEWTPAHYADARVAWKGPMPHVPGQELRIEAGSYRGKPVYFQQVAAWTTPTRMPATRW